jgi:hypothetical protein
MLLVMASIAMTLIFLLIPDEGITFSFEVVEVFIGDHYRSFLLPFKWIELVYDAAEYYMLYVIYYLHIQAASI